MLVAAICTLATVVGYLAADAVSADARAAIDGFAAGALLVMLIDSMIPDARERRRPRRRPGHGPRLRGRRRPLQRQLGSDVQLELVLADADVVAGFEAGAVRAAITPISFSRCSR